MPFTLAHPAAAVPLRRFGLVLSALVVGSMAPDFPYFLPWMPLDQFGHTLLGVVWFCVPAGLTVLWLFHRFLKLPLISLFPRSHQERLMTIAPEFRFGPWKRLGVILLSLALGALTHLGWDLITHPHGWMVRHWPVLRTVIWGTRWTTFRLYFVLQYGSTFVGSALMAHWYLKWLRNARSAAGGLPAQLSPPVKACTILVAGLGALILAAAHAFVSTPSLTSVRSMEQFARYGVMVTIWVALAILGVYGLLWHLFLARHAAKRI